MTLSVGQAVNTATQSLRSAGCDSPKLDAEVLLAHALDQDRTWLHRYPGFQLNSQQAQTFFELIERRRQREPAAYIVGHKEFFALDFLVEPAVLIPRPETELLVETALAWAQRQPVQSVVDVGTGSGCIAIALARHLHTAAVAAVDISAAALEIARQNARRHQVDGRIRFFQGDLLAPIVEPVDLIASNPPYISQPTLNHSSMMPEVRCYEPRLALDGGADGLEVIRRLLAQAQARLRPGGVLLAELGFDQGQAAVKLAQGHFPEADIQVKPDLAGLDRLLVIKTRSGDRDRP